MDQYQYVGYGYQTEEESCPKTIYIGSLDPQISEELLMALFTQFGQIRHIKLVRDVAGDPFAFIEYDERPSAEMAISAMMGRVCLGKKMKVNWAVPGGTTGGKIDTSKHYHIFVGDIGSDIVEAELKSAFSQFGTISDCRVVRDPATLKSKNYGFISFVKKEAAEVAIKQMNGYWLGSRSIRTNWALRKPPSNDYADNTDASSSKKKPSYEEVASRASSTNSTIFCGKIGSNISETMLNDLFSRFGLILEIRAFRDKGYGFVRFLDKSSAVKAIIEMNNADVNGDCIKVSWGKEYSPNSSTTDVGDHQEYSTGGNYSVRNPYGEGYPQSVTTGYWNQPQSYQDAYAIMMRQQQYYQANMQGYPYYYAYANSTMPVTPTPVSNSGTKQQNGESSAAFSTQNNLGFYQSPPPNGVQSSS